MSDIRPTPEEYKKLEEEIIELLKKYPNLSVTVIAKADEEHGYLVCGSMCPVCATELMIEYVVLSGLEHHSAENRAANEAILKSVNGDKKVH